MMREILIVDDDPSVRELLEMYLTKEEFEVRAVDNGVKALDAVKRRQPALVLLDIMMPQMDGYEVCRILRANYDIPIIFLTCKDDDMDPIIGLEVGADDYITKPFNPREVVARVKAVLRRTEVQQPGAGKRITTECLDIYRDTREVWVLGKQIKVTPKEFDILWLLASHSRVVFSRQEIMRQVWGYEGEYYDMRTVDTHVKRLRKKIAEAGCKMCTIETVWGTGYRFVVDPDRDFTAE